MLDPDVDTGTYADTRCKCIMKSIICLQSDQNKKKSTLIPSVKGGIVSHHYSH